MPSSQKGVDSSGQCEGVALLETLCKGGALREVLTILLLSTPIGPPRAILQRTPEWGEPCPKAGGERGDQSAGGEK